MSIIDDFTNTYQKGLESLNDKLSGQYSLRNNLDTVSGRRKYFDNLLEDYNLPNRDHIDIYNNYYRFGLFNPYEEVQSGREYLFFIKPDLYIAYDKIVNISSVHLQPDLNNNPFFIEASHKWGNVIKQLQYQADPNSAPFSLMLSNAVSSSLDLPGLQANTISNPVNNFGTSYDYRGSSEASDDNYSFSLEFRDTKYLNVYMYFRIYEEYMKLKQQGRIHLYNDPSTSGSSGVNFDTPLYYSDYIINRKLHDQFGIFKFILMEDMETILHYSYYCGCMWTSLPRDSFNDANFDDGLKYAIDGKAAFVLDMNPIILGHFNSLVESYNKNQTTEDISLYNTEYDMVNFTPAKSAYILKTKDLYNHIQYKLKFRK